MKMSGHQSNDFVKLLLIGDAKSGKTGSLVSLVKAGYKLRILDFDNLLDILKFKIIEICPDKIDNVDFITLRDEYKATAEGNSIKGMPKAWIEGVKLSDNWKYKDTDGEQVDLGSPATWGNDTIYIIDSLSRLCDAAYDYHEAIAPRGKSGEYDGRAVYGSAQDAVEKFIAKLTSKYMATNVILIAHGQYMDLPDGTTKIFPQGVGQKLSPKIPQYFPNVVRYKNQNGKRTIQVNSDAMIDLANTNPTVLSKSLSIETGLAEFFEALRGPLQETKSKVTLKRVS